MSFIPTTSNAKITHSCILYAFVLSSICSLLGLKPSLVHQQPSPFFHSSLHHTYSYSSTCKIMMTCLICEKLKHSFVQEQWLWLYHWPHLVIVAQKWKIWLKHCLSPRNSSNVVAILKRGSMKPGSIPGTCSHLLWRDRRTYLLLTLPKPQSLQGQVTMRCWPTDFQGSHSKGLFNETTGLLSS